MLPTPSITQDNAITGVKVLAVLEISYNMLWL